MSESKSKEKKGKEPSKCRFKSICVFGGSTTGKDREFLKAARDLGNALAARKIKILYGGGIQGLDGTAAMCSSLKGGKLLAVRVKGLDDNKYILGTEVRVSSLPERMGCLLSSAETFIALPGGMETLEAISSLTYWASLNFHKKRIGLLNVNGFYDSLLSFLDQAVEQGFIPQATRRVIVSASTADELIDQLQNPVSKLDPAVDQIECQSSNSHMEQEPDTTLRL